MDAISRSLGNGSILPLPAEAGLGDAAPSSGRIGPNAITRLAEAMDAQHGNTATRSLFVAAGLARYLDDPPGAMVDETEVITLHRTGRAQLGLATFAAVARLAGQLTGDYVLRHRIPRPARILLRLLPGTLASKVLVRAIAAHAWTFAGSGGFSYQPYRHGMLLIIRDSPLARGEQSTVPLCDFYTATFERIFRQLVSRKAEVSEVGCAATGARACCFDVRF